MVRSSDLQLDGCKFDSRPLHCRLKAKFHYASWFKASNLSATSFELDSIMEFGFEPVCDQL